MVGFFFSIDFHYLDFKLLKPWDEKFRKKQKNKKKTPKKRVFC